MGKRRPTGEQSLRDQQPPGSREEGAEWLGGGQNGGDI